jgi:hypothetical protein
MRNILFTVVKNRDNQLTSTIVCMYEEEREGDSRLRFRLAGCERGVFFRDIRAGSDGNSECSGVAL